MGHGDGKSVDHINLQSLREELNVTHHLCPGLNGQDGDSSHAIATWKKLLKIIALIEKYRCHASKVISF